MTTLNIKFPCEGRCNYPLFERIKEATSIAKNKKLCIYLYDRPDASTFRYRVYNVCQLLENSEKFGATYFYAHEIGAVFEILRTASLLVLCRTQWSNEYEILITESKRLHIPVIFDCDDLVVDISKIPMVSSTILADLNGMLLYASKLFLVAKQANYIFSTNSYLLERITNLVHKKGYVIPNFFNNEQLEYSIRYTEQKTENPNFTIGYFSGSPSHFNDLNVCLEEIIQFLIENKNSELVIAGHISLHDKYAYLKDIKRIEYLPFSNYLDLQKMISNVDLNIAPLVLNEFTNCKSDLKYFEASIVSTPTIASPTYSFLNSIDQGINGLLCYPGEWYSAIRELFANPEQRQLIANNAFENCLDKYEKSRLLTLVESAFSDIINDYSC